MNRTSAKFVEVIRSVMPRNNKIRACAEQNQLINAFVQCYNDFICLSVSVHRFRLSLGRYCECFIFIKMKEILEKPTNFGGLTFRSLTAMTEADKTSNGEIFDKFIAFSTFCKG